MADNLYETDFYTWTQRQGALLRAGKLDEADLANIAEEMETLGRSEAAALRSSYRLIALHLLKMTAQPAKATRSWDNTVHRERLNVGTSLKDNPGLKPRRAALFADAYETARTEAAFETRLPLARFPQSPPFGVDDAESPDYWPEGFPLGENSARKAAPSHAEKGNGRPR